MNPLCALALAALAMPRSPDEVDQALMRRVVVETVERWRSAADVPEPGGVLAAARGGGALHAEAFGVADVRTGQEITVDTPFYIASVAKMFTALCIHELARTDRIRLDEPVASYLPELAGMGPGITVRHLLHHRSGIRDYYELGLLKGWDLLDPPPRDEILELLALQRGTSFPPGRDGGYSNSNYLLLGLLVERVGGVPLHEFARDHLFAPLGMEHTLFTAGDGVLPEGVATGHGRGEDAFLPQAASTAPVGAGGAYSTAGDLLRFATLLTSDAEPWRTLAAALTSAPERAPDEWLSSSLGDYRAGVMAREQAGVPFLEHPGGTLGFGAEFLFVPSLELAVVCVANRDDLSPRALALQVATRLGLPEDEAREARAPGAGRPPAIRTLLRDEETGAVVLLNVQGDKGALQGLGRDQRFVVEDATTLVGDGPEGELVLVLPDRIAPREAVELCVAGREPRVFLVPDEPETLSPSDLAGTWHSEELGGALTLVARSGGLVLETPETTVPVPPFRHLGHNVYVSVGRVQVLLEFHRGDGDTGLRMIAGTDRARGMLFRRLGDG